MAKNTAITMILFLFDKTKSDSFPQLGSPASFLNLSKIDKDGVSNMVEINAKKIPIAQPNPKMDPHQ